MARTTLDGMARGGLYDHLGGGFHRYSVDEGWLVPHFEKMLYDNAQLAGVYLDAYRLTGEAEYARVAAETLDYILREMTSPEGAFYSSQDADSDGEEGKYYVWSREEIRGALGPEDADVFERVYGVTEAGNFEGRNILHLPRPLEETAAELGVTAEGLRARLEPMKETLRGLRRGRVAPGRDDKVLADWNALMISALANGARTLGDEVLKRAAQRAGDFLLGVLRGGDGRLRHVTGGGQARIEGFLDDYAFAVAAMIDLYETDFDARWLEAAQALARMMMQEFGDGEGGGFFFTSARHANLLTRPKRWQDGPTPSGAAVAALSMLRLSAFHGHGPWQARAEATLSAAGGYLRRAPSASLAMVAAVDFHVGPVYQIAIVGKGDDEGMGSLLGAARRLYLPNAVVAARDPSEASGEFSAPDLVKRRKAIDSRTTAYVCEGFVCNLPVQEAEELVRQLGR